MKGLFEEFFKWKSAIVDMFFDNSRAQAHLRGQGAIEYLLIIGAAILVVAIVTIAITSVLNQGQQQSISGITSANSSFDQLKETSGAYYRVNNHYYLKSDPLVVELNSVWRMDNVVGGKVADTIGENSLTCSGDSCPLPVVGLFGENALQFDGQNDVLSLDTYPNSIERTISVWLSPGFTLVDSGDGKNYGLFITNVASGNNMGGVFLRNYYQDLIFYVCSFNIDNSCGVEKDIFNSVLMEKDKWYLLTVVSSKSSNFKSIYLNGVSLVAGAYGTGNATSPGIRFGDIVPDADPNKVNFKGKIGEISIWNKALSASDVNALYNNALSGN
ncbi:MAG: LamG-like jellyroll fold domain-containing protein [archaeon]